MIMLLFSGSDMKSAKEPGQTHWHTHWQMHWQTHWHTPMRFLNGS